MHRFGLHVHLFRNGEGRVVAAGAPPRGFVAARHSLAGYERGRCRAGRNSRSKPNPQDGSRCWGPSSVSACGGFCGPRSQVSATIAANKEGMVGGGRNQRLRQLHPGRSLLPRPPARQRANRLAQSHPQRQSRTDFHDQGDGRSGGPDLDLLWMWSGRVRPHPHGRTYRVKPVFRNDEQRMSVCESLMAQVGLSSLWPPPAQPNKSKNSSPLAVQCLPPTRRRR